MIDTSLECQVSSSLLSLEGLFTSLLLFYARRRQKVLDVQCCILNVWWNLTPAPEKGESRKVLHQGHLRCSSEEEASEVSEFRFEPQVVILQDPTVLKSKELHMTTPLHATSCLLVSYLLLCMFRCYERRHLVLCFCLLGMEPRSSHTLSAYSAFSAWDSLLLYL